MDTYQEVGLVKMSKQFNPEEYNSTYAEYLKHNGLLRHTRATRWRQWRGVRLAMLLTRRTQDKERIFK